MMFLLRSALVTRGMATGIGEATWIIHVLLRGVQPVLCLEIDSTQGWPACHLVLTLRAILHGHFYAIDPPVPRTWNELESVNSLYFLKSSLRHFGRCQYVTFLRGTPEGAARDSGLSLEQAALGDIPLSFQSASAVSS